MRQLADTLWIETDGLGDPAYESASACTVSGKQYAGAILISKARADATSGKLTLVFTGNYAFRGTATCEGTFVRESAADPGLTLTCP